MTEPKSRKRKTNQKEEESKQVMRRRLAWCNHTGMPYDPSEEQYSILPRALADEDGNPHKASKSIWTDKLESRYQKAVPFVFTKILPLCPNVVIIDATCKKRHQGKVKQT